MSEPIDQVHASSDRRARERRGAERRKGSSGTALMIIDPTPTPSPDASEPVAEAAFTAQVLGQTGQKRGLKGGPPVLEQARSAYLGAAYSGPQDRRPRPGRVTKTDI
jgi:hypothetical protein